MKKLLTLSICALLGLSAMAQQLPNAGFEEAWVDCKPWTSKGNNSTIGKTPTSWTIAQVIGMAGMGKTQVGEKAPGCESESAVKVYNSANSVKNEQIVPGYFTLGTTWSTAKGTNAEDADGGTFGGIKFTTRPDAVAFDFIRTHGTSKPDEQATVVAYMWKGTYKQADVPGNIALSTIGIKKVEMINRDRNILDMTTSQGGAVSKSEGAELIAKINYALTGDAAEWTNKIIEFEYLTASTPEMFNIIFSAGNYWNTAPGKDNSLTVDNVKLIYYSRLNSLKVGEQVVTLEEGKYDYAFDFAMPENDDAIVYALKGKTATAEVVRDEENHTATIKVTNVDADIDGEKEHNYVLAFAKPEQPIEGEKYEGTVTITLPEAEPVVQSSAIYINMTGENTCTFRLPNFEFMELPMGDIVVPDVKISEKDGVKTFTGAVEDLVLKSDVLGDVHADVTLNGTIDAEGNVNMKIPVIWYENGDVTDKEEGNMIPIDVVFVAKNTPTGVDEIEASGNGEVEYYNLQGIRVANPESGIYIRRQGSKVSKVYVK